ncbi:hypothetical protein ACQPW1_39860 [Nocardia sp. CA-128927]|uniref:hypothetical protein n=1 Tax=Nocardia sp. CA-128927 TaxID=3239975 RepID=UPI003D96ABB2
MAIPVVNGDGCLDYRDDPYPTTLLELYDRFVDGSVHRTERERIFSALRLQAELMNEAAGQAPTWIGGDFLSFTNEPPRHAITVYQCRDLDHMMAILDHDGWPSLLTLRDGFVSSPAATGIIRLKPVGGLVDAFLATPKTQPYWQGICSSGRDPDGQVLVPRRQGFVEVTV